MKKVIAGIAQTITDGIKDAEMQYTYATQAAEAGKPEVAMKHIEDAKQRLAGAKMWIDYGGKLLADDPLAEVLVEILMRTHKSALEKIAAFKPGA